MPAAARRRGLRCVLAGAGGLILLAGGPAPGAAGEAAPVYRAAGNEPGWVLNIGTNTLELITDYGARRVVMARPAPTIEADTWRYIVRDRDHALEVHIAARHCRDDMSGMPHPDTVTVRLDDRTLRGCGGDPAVLLEGGPWAVTAFGDRGDQAQTTLAFHRDGAVRGRGPCNDYAGHYTLGGETLTIEAVARSRMACAPALVRREHEFLDILGRVRRFEIGTGGALRLIADDGRSIVAHR